MAPSHHFNQCWSRFMPPCGITRPQWVNTLWPGDITRWHGFTSTLALVMAYYQTAPSHYLNLYWLFINEVLWHSPASHFKGSAQATILHIEFENYTFRIIATSSRGQWVNWVNITHRLREGKHAGINLSMRPANERRRYIVTSSLIGWAHTQNNPWTLLFFNTCQHQVSFY